MLHHLCRSQADGRYDLRNSSDIPATVARPPLMSFLVYSAGRPRVIVLPGEC
jgi:hypothetical protein